MHQCGGVESLAWLLLGESLRRMFAELFVDQRQQLVSGVRLAAVDRVKGTGVLNHGDPSPGRPAITKNTLIVQSD